MPKAAAKGSRDEFLPPVRDLLGKRAGYICAFPGCGSLTIGPSEDRAAGISMVGVAAHITAASIGGPRYDESLSPEKRSSEANGIWMCASHGKFIDDNPTKFQAQELHRWKKQHEDWIFRRVDGGRWSIRRGITNISLSGVGIFKTKSQSSSFGRVNIIAGQEAVGKTTICETIAALAGGVGFDQFHKRFWRSRDHKNSMVIEVGVKENNARVLIRLSQQNSNYRSKSLEATSRLQIEVNNNVSVDWPRNLFSVMLLDTQLYGMHHSDPKDKFRKGIRYLASVLHVKESVVWDSFRDDLYANSPLGYKFRRSGRYCVDILVPDGREYYLPHQVISHTEQSLALLDIILCFIRVSTTVVPWIVILDTGFFARFDENNKRRLFDLLVSGKLGAIQSFVCVNSDEDLEMLKRSAGDAWIDASSMGDVTIHSFR